MHSLIFALCVCARVSLSVSGPNARLVGSVASSVGAAGGAGWERGHARAAEHGEYGRRNKPRRGSNAALGYRVADGAADAAPTQEEESAGRFEAARAPSSRGAEFDYSGAVAYNREEHRYHCLTCCTATTEEHRWLEHRWLEHRRLEHRRLERLEHSMSAQPINGLHIRLHIAYTGQNPMLPSAFPVH